MRNLVKMIVPMATFALASVGAVATETQANAKDGGLTTGWRRIAPKVCDNPVQCNNMPSNICTTVGGQAKAYVGLDCTEPLFHTVIQ